MFPLIVHAAAVCRMNGQIIPCEQFGNAIGSAIGGFFWVFIFLWLFMMTLGILGIILWIRMLIHAATKNIDHKIAWIIVNGSSLYV